MKKYNLIGLKRCVLNLLKLLPTVFNKRILLSKVKSQSFCFDENYFPENILPNFRYLVPPKLFVKFYLRRCKPFSILHTLPNFRYLVPPKLFVKFYLRSYTQLVTVTEEPCHCRVYFKFVLRIFSLPTKHMKIFRNILCQNKHGYSM